MHAMTSVSGQCRIRSVPRPNVHGAALVHVHTRPVAPARFKKGERERDPQGDPICIYTSIDPVHGGICPFCQSVLMTLLEKQLPFREVRIDLGHKSEDFIDLYRSVIPHPAKKVQTPLLVDETVRLVESLVIDEYLEHRYGTGTQLLPEENAAAEAKIKLFIHYFYKNVVPVFEKLLHVSNELSIKDAHEELMDELERLDSFMEIHGSGSADYALGAHFGWTMHGGVPSKVRQAGYFLGPFYSLAEVALTPFVTRMVNLLPEWRGIDVLQEAKHKRLDRVVEWMEACLDRASAKKTDPSKEDLVNGMVDWEWSKM